MALGIDWDFIGSLEGKAITRGYVPNPDTSKSGVTVATGFDLGQRDASDIQAMALAPDLEAKLLPYCGLTGREAVDFLGQNPLTLSAADVTAIDAAHDADFATKLARLYDRALDPHAGLASFEEIAAAAQTVIASVAFQYGLDLKRRTPRFWATVLKQDWTGAVAELRNFGDAYSHRRHQEADLMATAIGAVAIV